VTLETQVWFNHKPSCILTTDTLQQPKPGNQGNEVWLRHSVTRL